MLCCTCNTVDIEASLTPPHSAAGRLQRLRLRWAGSKNKAFLCPCVFVCRLKKVLVTIKLCTARSSIYSLTHSLLPLGNSSSHGKAHACKRRSITKQHCVRARMGAPSWDFLVYVPAAACDSGRHRRASSISNNCIMPRDSRASRSNAADPDQTSLCCPGRGADFQAAARPASAAVSVYALLVPRMCKPPSHPIGAMEGERSRKRGSESGEGENK